MFIITVEGRERDGAYSVIDEDGEKVLYILSISVCIIITAAVWWWGCLRTSSRILILSCHYF